MVQFCDAALQDLERISAALTTVTGLRYMQRLVRALTETFGVAYAFVAERSPGDREVAQTVALAHSGGPVSDIVFLLAGTPCADVIRGGTCRLERGARYLYPGDRALMEMGVECYVGMLLAANGGTSCGWLGVMDTAPRSDAPKIEHVLRALGPRTSMELATMRIARAELAARDAKLRSVHAGFTRASD